MPTAPVVLGLNRTQDASACLMRGPHVLWAIQKERLTRRKHHWGRPGDVSTLYQPQLPGLAQALDVLVECYSSDPEAARQRSYDDELDATLRFAPDSRRLRISHHLAHAYSAFLPSPFDDAAVLVVDGQGSAVADFTESWDGARALPGDWREVASFYHATPARIACLAKQVWDRDDSRLVGLGMFYFLLTQAMFPGEGNEGKVMGLAPHGDARALGLPPLLVDGPQVRIPPAWHTMLRERARFRYGAPGVRFSDCANLAAAGQQAFEVALVTLARWLHAVTGAQHLCFAGGTALNCSANALLRRDTPFRQVFIPPAPGDAGTALGCALYGLAEVAGMGQRWRWQHDYLGPPADPAAIAAAVAAADGLLVEQPRGQDALVARLLDLLCRRSVVALCQGASEFGPRALGHRSILADPRHAGMRDWINARVKAREWFRPLAPVVLEEQAGDWFTEAAASPFMQFAVPVRPEVAARIPAVVHVDGTARLQTVGPTGDALLRSLLYGFAARTGVPLLLNTSFNGKDEPIIEHPRDAIAAFRRLPLHALALPPFLLRKPVEPERPE